MNLFGFLLSCWHNQINVREKNVIWSNENRANSFILKKKKDSDSVQLHETGYDLLHLFL